MVRKHKPVYEKLVDSMAPEGQARQFLKSDFVKASMEALVFGRNEPMESVLDEMKSSMAESQSGRYSEERWEWHDLYK